MESQVQEQLKKRKWLERSLFFLIVILIGLSFFVVLNRSGWRMDWSLQKINYLKYSHIGPDFSFRYPDHFHLDMNEDKKFGETYIAGFKLRTDQRTGCDIRYNEVGLNFQKSDQEIQTAIEKDLAKNTKEFQLLKGRRMRMGGEEAFAVDFNFLDPTGNKVHLMQLLTSHAGSDYLMVCGTGEYQYRYFQKDFDEFFEEFRWAR
jgi:hypothetical protein